jgi:hypothetical protein
MSHLPLSLWCWQDVVKAVFCGKVTVVDVYPDVYVRAVNIDVQLPSVIALNDYVRKGNEVSIFVTSYFPCFLLIPAPFPLNLPFTSSPPTFAFLC